MSVGIEDVAKAAGVSTATVSRALRGLKHVNSQTREHVKKIAAEMNYSISVTASRLASGKTDSIGVVAPYINRWYFSEVINGIERSLREAGLDLLLYNFSHLRNRERLFQHQLLRNRVDALIVISLPPTKEELDSMLSLGVPVALIGTHHALCASVAIDDVASARMATQHLVNQGHINIGLISGMPNDPLSFTVPQDRRRGFIQVIEENSLAWSTDQEASGDFTLRSGERAMDELLAKPNRPTAVFVASDEMAFGAMRAIRRHGLNIPEDISIIGFDGHDMSDFLELTTIEQPVQTIGELAAWALMEQLKNQSTTPPTVTVPTKLVVRNSTARLM